MQCEFILVAASDLDNALKAHDRLSTTRAWLALQTIVISAANLSKLFWGSRGKKLEERRPLRESLGVELGSCLQSPDLRNDFEHFDERIATWYDEHGNIFMSRNIGSPRSIVVGGEPEATRFGQFDPATGELTFWANTVQIKDVIRE